MSVDDLLDVAAKLLEKCRDRCAFLTGLDSKMTMLFVFLRLIPPSFASPPPSRIILRAQEPHASGPV